MLSGAQSWLVAVPWLAAPAEPTSALAAALGLPHRAHALSAFVSPSLYSLWFSVRFRLSFSPEAATGGR